ncbi:MAG: hypothetical protein JW818_21685 [Pirellulales bacterium]|nr:hypothetical protein [Pirellulales bacterium]
MERLGNTRWVVGLAGMLAMALAVGCSDSGSNTSTTTADGGSGASTKAESGPAATVGEFLEACRTGQDEKVIALLTPVARQERAKHGINGTPSRSDTAQYEVGEVTLVGDMVARVASTWTDRSRRTQQVETTALTWFLRHEDEGWRIGGVSTVIFENQPPLLLDFEKPLETERKIQLLVEELAGKKRGKPSASVAEHPTTPPKR